MAVDSTNPFESMPGTGEFTVPNCVVPEKKVTVPVGARPKLPPDGFEALCVSMTAVKLKELFAATGFALAEAVEIVSALVTVNASAVDRGLAL